MMLLGVFRLVCLIVKNKQVVDKERDFTHEFIPSVCTLSIICQQSVRGTPLNHLNSTVCIIGGVAFCIVCTHCLLGNTIFSGQAPLTHIAENVFPVFSQSPVLLPLFWGVLYN